MHEDNSSNAARRWYVISPTEIELHGILLTSSFVIENIHEHLSFKFIIKALINDQDANKVIEIFPNKGSIMRGESKKIRVKHSKQIMPSSQDNIQLKVFFSLNTDFNKQYMRANRLSGWEQVRNMPVQEFLVQVRISRDHKAIKDEIRQRVLLESEFDQVSERCSTLKGEENFIDIPEIGGEMFSKINFPSNRGLQPKQSELRLVGSALVETNQARLSSSRQKKGHDLKNSQPIAPRRVSLDRVVQGNTQNKSELNRKKRSNSSSHGRGFERPEFMTSKKQYRKTENLFRTNFDDNDVFKDFQSPKQKRTHVKIVGLSESKILQFDDYNSQSEASILRSLQNRQSHVQPYKVGNSNNFLHENYRQQQAGDTMGQVNEQRRSAEREDILFTLKGEDKSREIQQIGVGSNRNVEVVVLAVISAIFVALGSNFGGMFS